MDNGLEALYNQVQSDALHRGPNGADAYVAQTMQFLRAVAQARISAQRSGIPFHDIFAPSAPMVPPNAPTMFPPSNPHAPIGPTGPTAPPSNPHAPIASWGPPRPRATVDNPDYSALVNWLQQREAAYAQQRAGEHQASAKPHGRGVDLP